MSMVNSIVLVMLGPVLSAPVSAQDQPKTEKPKNPEVIQPSTACEGVPGAPTELAIECEKREAVRLLIIMDKPEAAMKVLCTTKAVREAFGNDLATCQKSN